MNMFPAKTLIAVRKAEDVETVCRFLREHNQHPRLIVAYLKLSEKGELAPLKFSNPLADSAKCEKFLEGFRFEIVGLDYEGEKFSASVFVERAAKENCDSIIVVSDNPKQLFTLDLATTLAVVSPLPVTVIKP